MNSNMNLEMLQAIIAVIGGEDKVAVLLFDNSSRKIFKKGEFNLEACMTVPGQEVLEFREHDMLGNEIRVFKLINCIQAVLGVNDAAVLDNLDYRFAAC